MIHQPCQILLIGVGGYAHFYIEALRKFEQLGICQLAAIIDPCPEKAVDWPYLKERGLPQYASVEAFVDDPVAVDLAVIASPISFHAQQACALLKAGINVLCEKPIAATLEEVADMKAARDESGKFLEIAYQWTFSSAMQQLKADVLKGALGKPEKLLTRVAWPRSSAYYNRNNWAGKIHNAQGRPVYDSPVNNATAHYLHNMLFVLGKEQHLSASPTAVTAECYRANAIENYDTACCKIETLENADIYFYTTHATETAEGPIFRYIFEAAEVHFTHGSDIVAHFKNGTQKTYGNPDVDRMLKLQICAERCSNALPQNDICGVEAASAHTLCVDALQRVPVQTIDSTYLHSKSLGEGETLIYVDQMESIIREAYEHGQLFNEQNLAWAGVATRVSLLDSLSNR
ncbi:Gfo/Idh/MocA family oxidoreductase [Coraliomargarita sp. SDUM461004]|uniref:Gfo/Idh/MocA family oxidoreductase n=1 Tax=Thalassobacterium sedimentorum TaxID=3041258 RepID=A0ABU1AIA6_9BACT|nr:Gfo/Idh/MocA family oxidoreductase [Coraliomargarita sp. SDUM461004]MDQ8194520.1 Gfo/Idh/MocA family oxidoreductase [Coraliomargarita sp. SDUM461004]